MRRRGDINSAITHVFSGTCPNKNVNSSLKYYENLQREVESRKTRSAKMLYRKQLKEQQNKINYTNELQRLRGELFRNDTRPPEQKYTFFSVGFLHDFYRTSIGRL